MRLFLAAATVGLFFGSRLKFLVGLPLVIFVTLPFVDRIQFEPPCDTARTLKQFFLKMVVANPPTKLALVEEDRRTTLPLFWRATYCGVDDPAYTRS